MDAKFYNGSDDRLDDTAKDWSYPDPGLYCSNGCGMLIERSYVQVHVGPLPCVHLCCSENCAADLKAKLDDEPKSA
jgi:hypothetical protein